MNRARDAWPLAKLISTISTGIATALLVISWALFFFGWINVDGFVSGLRDGLTVLAGGPIYSGAHMLLAALLPGKKR